MTFVLTRATISEMPEVAHVFRISREYALPYLPKLHTAEEDRAFFTEVVFPDNKVIVARKAGSAEIAGFIAFDKTFVHHLYLLPQYLHLGLGSLLLREALSARERLRLWAFQRNVNARAFYEKHGFVAINFTDGFECEEKEPDVLYEWHRSDDPTT